MHIYSSRSRQAKVDYTLVPGVAVQHTLSEGLGSYISAHQVCHFAVLPLLGLLLVCLLVLLLRPGVGKVVGDQTLGELLERVVSDVHAHVAT